MNIIDPNFLYNRNITVQEKELFRLQMNQFLLLFKYINIGFTFLF